MLFKLAKRVTHAMLAVSLVVTPVAGSMPTCCAKGVDKTAVTPKCCCERRADAAKKAQPEPKADCCAKSQQRSCCAKDESPDRVQPAKAPCCCKAGQRLPLLPTDHERVELRHKQPTMDGNVLDAASGLRPGLAFSVPDQSFRPPETALRVRLCRWLI